MKIVVLEDEDEKYAAISAFIHEVVDEVELSRVSNWFDYANAIADTKFDLILLDLLVPRSPKDGAPEDHHAVLVDTTRDYSSKSFRTPAIVLTRMNVDSGDFVHDLNLVDINVIPFNDHGEWKEALRRKILAARPPKRYEFVVVCALEKEAAPLAALADSAGPLKTRLGLLCQEVEFGGRKGVIVRAHRMGLVSAAWLHPLRLSDLSRDWSA